MSDQELHTNPDTLIPQDPIKLNIPDTLLIEVVNKRIEASERYYQEKKYPERRKRNRDFLMGQQIDREQLKQYESDYMDNLIYESENTIKPIALSRLPDMIVKPGREDDESQKLAEQMTDVVNSDLKKRENRKVLGLAFKHVPVYFHGVIKVVWDERLGEHGDYKFVNIHPENIVLDHTATTNNPDDMDMIAESRMLSIKELMMMFPNKADELIDYAVSSQVISATNKDTETGLATKIKVWEVWFTWYNNVTDSETGERKYEKVDGVLWKYRDLILGKMKNPYWDWKGERKLFTLEMGEKKEASIEDIVSSVVGEDTVNVETVYHNYFKSPRKPYIFLNYDMFGECPLDSTSRIEQVIPLQKDVNRRGAQIREMNDRAKPKFIFNSKFINKETVQELDLNNPDQDVMVGGDVRQAYSVIQSPPAPAPLYTELETERQKAFSKMGTNATTRGVREGQETATARQLFKESDFGRIDDVVEETINDAAEHMAQWAMQMIKLYYTKEHMRRLLGADGDVTFTKISQDSIEDGQEVVVSASGVDKMQAKREAFERAGMQLTDPLTFFIDTKASDPIGRTKKLLTFMQAPELYIQQYVEQRNVDQMGQALQQQPITPGVPDMGMQPPQGQPPMGGGGDVDPLGIFS